MSERRLSLVMAFVCLLSLPGCAPEVGSKRWCEALRDKPQGDWTINETADYASHCLFRSDIE